MLSSPIRQPRRPQQLSLRQEYAEFLEQRIEEYKEQLSREQLLAVADDAVRELELASEEQLVLTEVLVLEHVDRLIMRRLNLPTFRKWRHQHVRIRQAQRDPMHWGIDADGPIVDLATQLGESDRALVLGEGAIAVAHLLAAFEWPVLFIDPNLAAVEAAEALAAAEGLASRIQALVVHLGHWFPDIEPTLLVMDSKTLSDLQPSDRVRVLDTFKQMTKPGGVHCFIPAQPSDDSLPSAVIQAHYGDWSTQHRRNESPSWYLAVKPQQTSAW
jgi:hypothetical protein